MTDSTSRAERYGVLFPFVLLELAVERGDRADAEEALAKLHELGIDIRLDAGHVARDRSGDDRHD
jgi:hypothetical protein